MMVDVMVCIASYYVNFIDAVNCCSSFTMGDFSSRVSEKVLDNIEKGVIFFPLEP